MQTSVQFSISVVSNSLWPHESQHARLPCPSPTPGVYPNPCPLSWWCHPAVSSSVIPFSSCPQSLPASGFFPVSQLFVWGGQSTRVSASASVLSVNTQDWFPLRWIYAEYITRNAGLEEAQAGIKIAGRNTKNHRYADDATLMAESEEELKSLLMKMKEESEKVGLKLNNQKTKIMASSPITHGKKMGKQWLTLFFWAPNHYIWWLQPWN